MMDVVTLIMACSVFQNYSITNAMIQVGSHNNVLMVTPKDSNATLFPNANQAITYINQQIQQGTAVDIGVTQLPSQWLKPYNLNPAEAIKPCKNVVIASEIITSMWEKCGHIVNNPSDANQLQACALSMFKTGDPQAGLDYAKKVMHYADTHPFSEVAAPAMKHWEKYAKVPTLPTATNTKSPSKLQADTKNNITATKDADTDTSLNN